MPSEIFRFVHLRPPLATASLGDAVVLGPGAEGAPTPLHSAFLDLKRTRAARPAYEKTAREYADSDRYAMGGAPLPVVLDQLDTWLADAGPRPGPKLAEAVKTIYGRSAADLVASQRFRDTRERLADSFLARSVVPGPVEDQARIAHGLRLATLIERVAENGAAPDPERVLTAPILLPDDVFPLPPRSSGDGGSSAESAEQRRKAQEAAAREAEKLARTIEETRSALEDLARAFTTDTSDRRRMNAAAAAAPAAARVRRSGRTERPAAARRAESAGESGAPVLSAEGARRMAPATRKVLESHGVGGEAIDVPHAAAVLEAEIAAASGRLLRGGGARAVTRIGDAWVPSRDGLVVHPGRGWRAPGQCGGPAYDAPAGDPTVPDLQPNAIRPIGVADLLQVRQAVRRYELGEVAHIENVMIGERRQRTHRQTSRLSETLTEEVERTREESRDLQTTDRFELQQESSEVLREDSSREIALSVSASYGPMVEATASFTASTSQSTEQSRKNAQRYSREVTDRAVKKVQERVLERRTVTRELEVEETNLHAFQNREGTAHIRGIYRWVDKVYEAQVVSYGLRMLFEVVVPEPAAFYRHALGAAPREGLRLQAPDPPGYCQHPEGTFAPLVPGDLHEGNYQLWVAKYGATDVQPPPALYRTVGLCLSDEPESEDDLTAVTSTELQAPTGYRAERAYVRGDPMLWDTDAPNEFVSFVVGRSHVPVGGGAAMNGEDGVIPIAANGFRVAGMAVTVEVLCARSREAFEAWQLATYGAIMTAYNDLKGQYEAALARAEVNLQNATAITGRNPALNRDTERTELKRAALSVLTQQHFDTFDAMRRGVPPYGYPQADLGDARAEAGFIQFFEQAFEWSNMSYRFYPYFWGRKAEWPAALRLGDADPLFGRFLQAGAARVQVPVRPGFEEALLHLLQTANKPWETADNAFGIAGPLYHAMVDEIKEEQRGAFTKGAGSVTVQPGSDVVQGSGTAFDKKLHEERELIVLERTYRVREVRTPTELVLDRSWSGQAASDLPYSFGVRLVGDPWEVRVPTSLVMLQESQDLPQLLPS